MKALIALAVVTALIALYVVWLRPLMKATPWGQVFLAKAEPIERTLWKNSETIFFARTKIVVGALLATMSTLGTIDLTPLMPFVPDAYEPMVKAAFNLMPLLITIVGFVDEKLRRDTTKPLEIVAMRTDAPVEVKIAAAQAEAANANAVATVEAAKAA